MNKASPANIASSVSQRLLNLSRAKGEDFQFVLTKYAAERLLYRLSLSQYADQFVLKGASLIAVWTGRELRPTRDVDLLGRIQHSDEQIREIFQHICSVNVELDGLQFDPVSIRVANIREGQAYEGRRVRIPANLGNARITVQIDIGFGDAVTPSANEITYPTLLDFPAPRILAYPPESIVSEKLEALVSLGMANTRMKDFYDLRLIARSFSFQGSTLLEAIQATFNRRRTDIPASTPTALSEEFAEDENKQRQWTTFLSRSGLDRQRSHLAEVIQELHSFLVPPLKAAATNTRFIKSWGAGGTWV